MNWPWDVRVRGRRLSVRYGDARLIPYPPDYYTVEIRISGKWYDAGTGKTWFEAFLMGLVA